MYMNSKTIENGQFATPDGSIYQYTVLDHYDSTYSAEIFNTVVLYNSNKHYVGTVWKDIDIMYASNRNPDRAVINICKYIQIWMKNFMTSMKLQEWLNIYTNDATLENI
jgi:hypothetical protein